MGFSFVVLTTFYPAAQRAVHYADDLASTLGGQLVLLHINRASVNGLYAFAGEAWKQQELQLATQTSAQLHQMAKQLHTSATVELATDLLPTVAQDLAGRYPTALFVIGLSDADTPSVERLCATALDLLRAAQQPVLVVPRSTRAASPPHRVLIAADQETFALPNTAAVNELLRGLGAELTVAHVSTVEDDAGCAQALQAVEGSGLITGLPTVNLRGYLHLSPAAGLLEAAVAAGVPRFIPSDYSIDYTKLPEGSNRNLDLRREFNARLDKAPIAATSILNGMFTDLLTGQAPVVLFKLNRVVYWGRADQPLDFTTTADTAAFTAAAALDPTTPRYLRVAGEVASIRDLQTAASEATGEKFGRLWAGPLGVLGTMIKVTRARLCPPPTTCFRPGRACSICTICSPAGPS